MKESLDKYITDNYNEVLRYTKHFLDILSIPSSVDAEAVISNAYLHCVELNVEDITINKAKSYLLNTIKCELLWTQGSKTKKQDIYTSQEHLMDIVEDLSDLEHKIILENKYNHKKGLIEIYRKQQKDRIKRIVFEAYYDKGHSTQTALAKYFDINNTSAYFLIKEIKEKINEIQYRYEES